MGDIKIRVKKVSCLRNKYVIFTHFYIKNKAKKFKKTVFQAIFSSKTGGFVAAEGIF
ncbi:MAG: hypothetical protein RLZZ612_1104 [Pseudomonadota bacterium]|jgi:hypothetical protein